MWELSKNGKNEVPTRGFPDNLFPVSQNGTLVEIGSDAKIYSKRVLLITFEKQWFLIFLKFEGLQRCFFMTLISLIDQIFLIGIYSMYCLCQNVNQF